MKLRMPSQPFLQIANTVILLGICIALGLCAFYLGRIDGKLADVPSSKSLREMNPAQRKEAVARIPIVDLREPISVSIE